MLEPSTYAWHRQCRLTLQIFRVTTASAALHTKRIIVMNTTHLNGPEGRERARSMRIIVNGRAALDSRLRTAVSVVRERGHRVEVRVTWEAGDARRFAFKRLWQREVTARSTSSMVWSALARLWPARSASCRSARPMILQPPAESRRAIWSMRLD